MIEIEQLTDPERKLWAHVLLQALADLGNHDPIARPARFWFTSKNDSVGSFIWICHQLSLDPAAVRERVLRDANRKLRESIASPSHATHRAA
jgi:hypothetical protein